MAWGCGLSFGNSGLVLWCVGVSETLCVSVVPC
jgi:hypothetical protein